MNHHPNPDQLLDDAIAAVREEPVDPQTLVAARDRVQRRLAAELDAAAGAGSEHRIRGCDGFRGLIPAYLAGALSEPRRILFEDHTRECVPCRRALADARRGGAGSAGWRARRERSTAWRYALAAGVAGLVIAGAAIVSGRLGLVGPDASARVRAIEGELVALAGGAVRPVAAGDALERGDTVRTGSGSGAVFELADGSRVELAARSQLALARRSDGVVLDLERGALIVEAAERKRGRLYVRTDDCLVTVVGTIFSVNHGVRGSRVSVLDGEVRVDGGARHAVLRPGDQLATTAQLGRVSLADEISWSRNAADYRERIAALAALGRELDATLVTGGRTSTALVDRAPAGTAIWVGLPNVADQLSTAWALVEQRVAENPALAQWWSERFAGADAARIADTLDHLREFGSHLGEEIAVAVGVDSAGEPGAPLVFAQVVDAAGFDELLDAEIARLNAEAGAERLRRVGDPSAADAGEGVLYLWHGADGLFAASTSPTRLAELASGGFAGSALHGRLTEIYRDGTGWLVGVDAARILAASAKDELAAGAFAALGLADAEHFLLESETVAGVSETRAALAFAGARRGAVAWLAAPAPSGALEFVSPAASFVVAGISKRPVEMFDDLLALARTEGGEQALAKLAEAESKLGFSLRDDLATALGGDAAFALDGPLLPSPSWKAIVEVVDPSRLEFALGRAIEAVNREAAAEGHPGLRFGQEEVDGRRYLTLGTDAGVSLAAMSFVDGYLVAAPSRALVVEAIALRDAGTHLVASQAFRDLLPSDAETDFSALVWQNFGGAAGPLGQLLGSALPADEREQIEALSREIGPTLVLAYGDADRVRLVSRGSSGPLGLSFEKLLALAGALRAEAPTAEDAGNETPAETTA